MIRSRTSRRGAAGLLVVLALAACGDGERVAPLQSSVAETATTATTATVVASAPSTVSETTRHRPRFPTRRLRT